MYFLLTHKLSICFDGSPEELQLNLAEQILGDCDKVVKATEKK